MGTLKEIMASNIARLIKEKGISQAGLARELDLETLTIHHYTTGHRFPKPENIDAICAYFKISYSELVKDKEAPAPLTMPVSKTLQRLMAVPDSVYNAAERVSINNEVWRTIEGLLGAAAEIEEEGNGKAKGSIT